MAVIVGSSLAAPLLRRAPPQRVAAAGLAVIAGGDAALILVASYVPALSACIAAAGFGIGMSSVATTTLGTSVALKSRGTASGVINTTAQLGTAIGIAALVLVATATTGAPGRPHRPTLHRVGRCCRPRRGRRDGVYPLPPDGPRDVALKPTDHGQQGAWRSRAESRSAML